MDKIDFDQFREIYEKYVLNDMKVEVMWKDGDIGRTEGLYIPTYIFRGMDYNKKDEVYKNCCYTYNLARAIDYACMNDNPALAIDKCFVDIRTYKNKFMNMRCDVTGEKFLDLQYCYYPQSNEIIILQSLNQFA